MRSEVADSVALLLEAHRRASMRLWHLGYSGTNRSRPTPSSHDVKAELLAMGCVIGRRDVLAACEREWIPLADADQSANRCDVHARPLAWRSFP